jgi:hypothetical protein
VLRKEHVKQLLRPAHLWVLFAVVIGYSSRGDRIDGEICEKQAKRHIKKQNFKQ